MFATGSAFRTRSYSNLNRKWMVGLVPTAIRSITNDSMGKEVGKKFLHVPFSDKDEVKALGGKWDKDSKAWYIMDGACEDRFKKWTRIYLNVPFVERMKAKSMGALWDPNEQKWYILGGALNAGAFEKWCPMKSEVSSFSMELHQPKKQQPKVARVNPSTDDNIVIIDLDTNGLPLSTKGRYVDYTDLINYDSSRIVRIAYALCHKETFEKVESGSYIVKTDGFPINNSQFHGITESLSASTGMSFVDVAQNVISVIGKARWIIAHNVEFDMNIFKSELFRYGLFAELQALKDKKELCSMNMSTQIIGLVDKAGKPKRPSLKELVNYSLGEDLPNPHDAVEDVEFLRRCLQHLLLAKKISIPPP